MSSGYLLQSSSSPIIDELIIFLGGVEIDMTNTGASTLLFTTGATAFFVIGIGNIAVNIDSFISPAQINFGWIAPDYSNFAFEITLSALLANGVGGYTTPGDIGIIPTMIIPPATSFFINIDAGASAISDIEQVFFIGFYL